jgi:hypothetical protein
MAFKKGVSGVNEGDVHTGTEAWNIAQHFTGFSIALPLKELNDLEDIARFGSVQMDDELIFTADIIDKRRADAVKRYWQKLKQIVSDTLFKVKKVDKEKAKAIYDWLLELPKYFDGLLTIKRDDVSNEDMIKVNEEFLTQILDKLVNKKQEFLFILDRTGLIFRETDEVDLDKLMQDYVQGG